MNTYLIAFVASLVLIVILTAGLGWDLSSAESSVIVLFVLLATLAVKKISSRRKGGNQDANSNGPSQH